MKRFALFAAGLCAAVFAYAETVAYIATNKNIPQTGWSGEVQSVQFVSTNATGTATVSAVTDILVDGKIFSFTNDLASVTLTGGNATVSTNGLFVASNQRIIVSGTAFPGGAATVWLKK